MKKEYKFRPSALNERESFYEREFSIKKLKSWFKKNRISLPQLCALDAGTETGIIRDKKWKGSMFFFPFSELRKKIKKYIPEDVYYDRNKYQNPEGFLKKLKHGKFISQELVFDLDADNIKCKCKKKEKICNNCLKQVFTETLKLKKELERDFRDLRIVYSGRGFHIHVLDKKAYLLTLNERRALSKKFSKYPIDPWVSGGYIELVRLPYSLNGLVSRKVIPLEKSKLKIEETIPRFLKN